MVPGAGIGYSEGTSHGMMVIIAAIKSQGQTPLLTSLLISITPKFHVDNSVKSMIIFPELIYHQSLMVQAFKKSADKNIAALFRLIFYFFDPTGLLRSTSTAFKFQ